MKSGQEALRHVGGWKLFSGEKGEKRQRVGADRIFMGRKREMNMILLK